METRDLSDHAVYRAGRGIDETARELGVDPADLIKLSSNENPLGPSQAAVDAIRDAAPESHTYPKTVHVDLQAAIADRWDLPAEQVWLGAGGDAVIDYLGRTFLRSGETVLVPRPGFAYYPMSARYHGGDVREYRLEEAQNFGQTATNVLSAYHGERIVYVTTPHNPTGAEMPPGDIETIADETRDETLVVVDEAYGEFTDATSARSLLDGRDDIAILRTFSKVYGLAGLRLGYALVPSDWATAYERINTPFAVNSLACVAGMAALKDTAHRQETIETVSWARRYMQENLAVPTWESGGNFVMADVGDAGAISTAAKHEGVLVRDCTSFGLSSCIRISCGTRRETTTAVEVLNEVTGT